LYFTKATLLFFISIVKKKTTYMSKKLLISFASILFVFLSAYFISCSKPNTTPPAPTCADKTIVITGTTTNTSGGTTTNGSITVSATGSTGFTYSLGTGAFQATGSFTSIAAGTYTVTAKDDAGCTSIKSFTVAATACPTITITSVLTQATSATANNGAINATATGSTGFTYSIGTGPFQASGNFTGLTGNTSYPITAKDVNGCTNTTNFTVPLANAPVITVTTTTTQSAGPTATNGSISCTAAGGTGPYTFSLNGGAFLGPVFNNLVAANYTVVAKDVNGNLSASFPVIVSFVACPTITIATVVVGSELCAPTAVGSVTVNASGSTGLQYRLGTTGTYQPSNIFNALNAGTYSVGVIDANGCTSTASATVSNLPQGPLFTNVKAVLAANCALSGCHAGANPQNGINFTIDCEIVTRQTRINARAVVAGTMPPTGAISAADKQKITDWINAGGKYSN
jgi:SprB repeat